MDFSRYTVFRNVRYQPKRFSYRPRFYKPEQEELNRRKQAIDREVAREKGEDVGEYVPGQRIQFRRQGAGSPSVKRDIKTSNLRLILIIGVLTLTIIYLFRKLDTFFVN